MKSILFLFPTLLLLSCRESATEVEVSETRPLTTLDENQSLNASSMERFLPADLRAQIEAQQSLENQDGSGTGAGNWAYELPPSWKEAAPKTMREVNLTFGDDDSGEVYLSVFGGGVQANADRWFRQFGNEPQPLAELGRVPFLGEEAYLVVTQGRYEAGMGRPGKDGQALLGVLVEKEGRLYTVKMVGDEAEVSSRREEFLSFLLSLKRAE